MIACEMVVSVFVLTVLKLILVLLRNAKCNVHANVIMALYIKEVCNGGVACSLFKLGSLKKTVIAFLFHSGLHSGTIFSKMEISRLWGS